MAEHRPTLGSELAVLRDPIRNKLRCAAGCGTWPCKAANERGDQAQPDEEPAPLDFIQIGKDIFPLNRRDRRPQ